MNPLIIVPFHEPKWYSNSLQNINRQNLKVDSLFVLNGKAKSVSYQNINTVISDDNHAAAVNSGVAWAISNGYTHVILFDSDDYYGAEYVKKVTTALRFVDYCGQRQLYIKLQDDSIHLMDRPDRSFVFATIGFDVYKFVHVNNILDNCDDWSKRMNESGCSSVETGPEHYCYSRHGQNAHWDGTLADVLVRRTWGPSIDYGKVPMSVCETQNVNSGSYSPIPTDSEVFKGMLDTCQARKLIGYGIIQ